MAAITPLTAVTFLAAEKAALLVAPGVEDLVGMQQALLADLNLMVIKLNYMAGLLPAGANKTTIQTLVTTLS